MAVDTEFATAPTEAEGPGISEYLGVFKRRVKTIFLPLLAFTVIAGLVAFVIPPQYEAFTKFKVKDPGVLRGAVAGTQAILPHKQILNTIESDIKRRPFIEPIIKKIALSEGFIVKDPEEADEFYKYIYENLNIGTVPSKVGADVVTISYRGRDRNKIVEFINSILEEYYTYFRNEYRDQGQAFHQKAKSRLEDAKRGYARVQTDYEAFQNSEDFRLIALSRERKEELISLRNREQDVRIDIRDYDAQLKLVDGQIRAADTESVRRNMVPNPKRAIAKAKIDKLQALYNEYMKQNFTDLIPDVPKTRQALKARRLEYEQIPPMIEGNPVVERNKALEALQAKQQELQRKIGGRRESLEQILSRISFVRNDLDKIPNLELRGDAFKMDIGQMANRVSDAERGFTKIDGIWQTVKGKGSDLFEVLEYPRNTEPAVFPSVPLFLAIGAAAGMLFGIGIAFLKEFSGMTYMSAAQVQSTLPIPILGEVSRITTVNERRSERSRRFRSIVTALVIVGLLGFLHLCYFLPDLLGILPPVVIDVMDMVYRGK